VEKKKLDASVIAAAIGKGHIWVLSSEEITPVVLVIINLPLSNGH